MLSQKEIEEILQKPNENRATTVADLQMVQEAIRETDQIDEQFRQAVLALQVHELDITNETEHEISFTFIKTIDQSPYMLNDSYFLTIRKK